MLKLRFQGKWDITGDWDNITITVHNRKTLMEWVRAAQTGGYQTFGLYLENGSTLLECSPNGMYWHKTEGFRP